MTSQERVERHKKLSKMTSEWCSMSGFTAPGEVMKRYFHNGDQDFIKCPKCGRVLKSRRHMISMFYYMIPYHKYPKGERK